MVETTLALAQSGDSEAFAELTNPYRRELLMHCYRILGSFQDAEDVLQETLLSAWKALDRFDGRALRAWLYQIATNRSLNYLRDSSRQPASVTPSAAASPFASAVTSEEPWWLEPYPDALIADQPDTPEARYDTRESIGLAFVAGLQQLPPQQRAALVVRDVLGFSAQEAADILETTPASINSALQRARGGFRPSVSPDRLSARRSHDLQAIVDRFVDAFDRGDIDAVVALLTDDAKVTMPPEPFEFRGRAAIAQFYRAAGVWRPGIKLVVTSANGQPAVAYYLPDPNANIVRAAGLLVLDVEPEGISAITRFGDRALIGRFGLPRTLPC